MNEQRLSLLQRAQGGDQAAMAELVENNCGLIWSVAKRFFGKGCDPEDLFQLGSVGFLKAVRGFDQTYGTQFSTYAVPKIAGEILRFLRDDGTVKVGRGLKERSTRIRQVRSELEQKLGREPSVGELSSATGWEPEEIAMAESATGYAQSLQEADRETGLSLEHVLSDHQDDKMLEYAALRQAIGQLPLMEKKVIALRFYRGLTQQKAADVLAVSQVQVSRLERRAIDRLRVFLNTDDEE